MFAGLLIITTIAAHLVAADKLTTWLSDMCTNARMDSAEPVDQGTCYEFGQAQSYILTKDSGKTLLPPARLAVSSRLYFRPLYLSSHTNQVPTSSKQKRERSRRAQERS